MFHPAVESWFREELGEPTAAQTAAWPAVLAGSATLIAAPTGSGKTLAAFLACIDQLVRESLQQPLPDETRVVYVSPLKALSNDIQLNLERPLAGISRRLERDHGIRSMVRTGDTPGSTRQAMTRRPPHILVTTPESLYILLTSEGGRRMLATTRTLIVDEIHAVADDRRGAHLALSMERLGDLVERRSGRRPVRIGLSATQRPIEEVARFLVGAGGERCEIVDHGHRRELDLALELPRSPLEAVMPGEVWNEIYDRLARLIDEHRTTLIFVNTRRLTERVARHLSERLGEGEITAHHGSLSREQRLDAEQRLKSGRLRALVATASLELGIDVGEIDLVCNIGSTRSISTLLQRVGRSGHCLGGLPKGRLFPTTRDELLECSALLDAVDRGELEQLSIPANSLDVLAQQIVAAVAAEDWSTDELYRLVRRAWPYRDLDRAAFDDVVRMVAEGFATRRGRRGALIHHDAVNGRLRGRRGARLAAMTSGGAIPDAGDYRVVLQPAGTFIGTVDEDFAVESLAGDIFQLGNTSWRIQKIEQGRVLVEDARGEPPNIPFWFGEAPGRTAELSSAVSRLRSEIAADPSRAERVPGLDPVAARQLGEYVAAAEAALTAMPTDDTIVLERFFDEAGNQHLVIHSPRGVRLNRAWGLALRKRFCRSFNFELQAAANDDAIVLSLGPTHSFPAEETLRFLHSNTVRDLLTQALFDAPVFPIRWRWNASRALALLRFRGGKKVPPRLQRMQAEDLIAVVFPDQLACLENIAGDREIPDHPLIAQTIRDCLEQAMDIEGLEGLLTRIEAGELRLVVRELREPSPLAHEILNARPYAFLDDAPLEERRTQAVQTRRWIDAESAADLGRLDPEAIRRVRAESWPEARNADEVHDALVTSGVITVDEAAPWSGWLDELARDRRAARGDRHWVAAERLTQWAAVHPAATLAPAIEPAPGHEAAWEPDTALVELLRGRLEVAGPVTVSSLAESLRLPAERISAALTTLEAEGFVMQGSFSGSTGQVEWCERRLLARIHRYTLTRLRREIEPVAPADYLRFLGRWQHLTPETRMRGPECVAAVLDQLEGFEAPAAAWEEEILPARIEDYEPQWLDALCLAGRIVWRRGRPGSGGGAMRPIRTTPVVLIPRSAVDAWSGHDSEAVAELSVTARRVRDDLSEHGASFFAEIVERSDLLRTQVETALAELVGAGLATSDTFAGLRALLAPSDRRPPLGRARRRSAARLGMDQAGRWALVRTRRQDDRDAVAQAAWALLRRYGVLCRALLDRESFVPPWRDLLRVLRRLEARGEIRGGRFLDGFSGEQYALAEAVAQLRKERRTAGVAGEFSISAADPYNLCGVVVPGPRVSALVHNRLLYRDGLPIAVLEAGEPRFLVELDTADRWPARNALVRRRVPPGLRAWIGRSA